MHNDSCYFFNNGPGKFYKDDHFISCGSTEPGGFAQCCQPGTYCLSDGICMFDYEPRLVSKKASLYYAGLCTDPSGKADVCRNECFTSDIYYYIKWLGDSWKCCYGPQKDDGDCTDPKGLSFQAPAPDKLSTSTFLVNPRAATSVLNMALPVRLSIEGVTNSAAVESYVSHALATGKEPAWFKTMPTAVQTYFVKPTLLGISPSSTFASTSGPTIAAPSPTKSNAPGASGSSSNDNNNNLGVKVGVPVGVVVGLLILAIAGFFIWRQRRNRRTRNASRQDDDDTVVGDTEPKARQELAGSPGGTELPSSPAPIYTPRPPPSASLDQKSGASPKTHPAMLHLELESPIRPSELADTSSIHSQRAELLGSTTPAKD